MRVRNTSGLSLVETMVSITLFTLLMGAVMTSVATLYRVNSYSITQAYEVNNARRGVQQFTRDVRETGFSDDGTFPLARKGDHLIGFYSDIDRDLSVEYVEYELMADTRFEKRIYNATGSPPTYDLATPDQTISVSEFVQNITNSTSTFYYYNENGLEVAPADSVTDVRYVEMQIIVNIDPIRNPGEFMLKGSAALRNIIN